MSERDSLAFVGFIVSLTLLGCLIVGEPSPVWSSVLYPVSGSLVLAGALWFLRPWTWRRANREEAVTLPKPDRRVHNRAVLENASQRHKVCPQGRASFDIIRPDGRRAHLAGTDLEGNADFIRARAAELRDRAAQILRLADDYEQIARYVADRDEKML